MVFLKVDPKWNNLRSDPRFIAIYKEVGFTDWSPRQIPLTILYLCLKIDNGSTCVDNHPTPCKSKQVTDLWDGLSSFW